MEGKLAKLNTKLALLDLTRGKTDGIVGTGIVEKIRRQKREVEEVKLENGESLHKVKEWGQEIEERIGHFRVPLSLSFKASLSAKCLLW